MASAGFAIADVYITCMRTGAFAAALRLLHGSC